MNQTNRRAFLRGTAAVAAGFAIGGTKASGRILGANDTIRLGVAGLNGRGGAHVDEFAGMEGVQVTYLIDPDKQTYDKRLGEVRKLGGNTPATVQDIRRALDDPELDAISIAAPNHWHALMTVWACQAGKDVYVEKPCSHNIHEGRVAVEAARKHDRIVQHGTQTRSSAEWARIAELVQNGTYGKLLVSRALCYKPRPSIGVKPIEAPPADLDYKLWLGPAGDHPFHKNLVHYNWHWFWDFGNGDIGNQGVHQYDVARWMIPGAKYPSSVFSLGGRLGYEDQGETPNTQISVMDFGGTLLVFEVRGLPTEEYMGEKVGNILHLEEGVIAGGKFHPKGGEPAEPLAEAEGARGPGQNHFANFIEAVRSRKTGDLNAGIEEGHYSSALCHLANISYRVGADQPYESAEGAIGKDQVVAETFQRMSDHLGSGNGLKLEGLHCRVGGTLEFDGEAERFVGNDAANALLTRKYAEGFAVPDKI
jgi:predicted dehydrogenase